LVRGFILGLVIAVVTLVAGGYFVVTGGVLPAGQDVKPAALERWAAKASLRATMRREARGLNSPLPADEGNLAAGAALYVAHCQVCHGGADGAASPIAKGLTPNAPQLAKDGVEDDPEGTIHWKIAHGIRFTGMPSYRQSLSEREMWQLALFAKHMDKLPPAAGQVWAAGKSTP
jgi:mono/diheme cytochrome c family protein